MIEDLPELGVFIIGVADEFRVERHVCVFPRAPGSGGVFTDGRIGVRDAGIVRIDESLSRLSVRGGFELFPFLWEYPSHGFSGPFHLRCGSRCNRKEDEMAYPFRMRLRVRQGEG